MPRRIQTASRKLLADATARLDSRPRVLVALPILLMMAVGCTTPRGHSADWHATAALCSQAESRLDRGDRSGAAESARAALARAAELQDPVLRGRALRVIGMVDESVDDLDAAFELLADSDDPEDEARLAWTAVAGARLALRAGREGDVERRLASSLEIVSDWDDPVERSRVEAWTYHLAAEDRRRVGDTEGAHPYQRRVRLALTMLPDDQELPLRLSATLRLGDDMASTGDFARAFATHAQAAGLARTLDDARAEITALGAQGRDLAGLGRLADAVSHAERGVTRALLANEPTAAAVLAREALSWLDALGVPADSPRRRPLHAALGVPR